MFLHKKFKKIQWSECRKPVLVVMACLLMTACASTKKVDPAEQRSSLDSLIKQADTEAAIGKNEQSIAILNQAAKENPTSMLPWLRMANLWFNTANYPSAILSANEVLLRESENQEAKSILVVAGLRVAAGAITGLVPQNPVTPGARAEAESLTKALRAALGEKVLVPSQAGDAPAPAAPTPAPVQHRRKHVAAVAPVTTPAPVATVTPMAAPTRPAAEVNSRPASAPVNTVSSGSDPFKSLK